MIWLKDVKYDNGGWTEGDDNDKDTRKDKDKMSKTYCINKYYK